MAHAMIVGDDDPMAPNWSCDAYEKTTLPDDLRRHDHRWLRRRRPNRCLPLTLKRLARWWPTPSSNGRRHASEEAHQHQPPASRTWPPEESCRVRQRP